MIQEQVLNKIINTKDASIISLNNLSADYFSDYKDEFNFILNHYKQYSTIPDFETFAHIFPEFPFIDVRETNAFLLDELSRDRAKRLLANQYNQVRQAILDDDLDSALNITMNLGESITKLTSLQSVDLFKDTSRYDAYLDKLNNPNKYYVQTGFKELDDILGGGWDVNEDLVTIVARNGLGKCLKKGTEILMADGSRKRVEQVRVGDLVQSENGFNTVLGLHRGVAPGFQIIPKHDYGSESFTVSQDHILTLLHKTSQKPAKYELVDIKIEDYMQLELKKQREYFLYRPKTNFTEKIFESDPYSVGFQISSRALALTKASSSKIPTYQYTKFMIELQSISLPTEYLAGSQAQRLQLLAGIIDGNLTQLKSKYIVSHDMLAKNGKLRAFRIRSDSSRFLKQVQQLASSLGFRAYFRDVNKSGKPTKGNLNRFIYIQGDLESIPIHTTSTSLQFDRISDKDLIKYQISPFTITPVSYIEYYGFMADGDHRYLLADGTITHNTWVLLKSAVAAAIQGKCVGIYSGEMSENTIGYRIDTLLGHISNGALMHGGFTVKSDYESFLSYAKENLKGSIKVITPKMINGAAGVNALRAFIEKDNLDILFIDQHSLLEDDRKAKNPVEKASNISKDLKLLQTTKRIPIVSVSQQNREKLEAFDTTQVAQSDRIAQDSSIVIFIERKEELMKLHLVKSRNTTSGKVLSYRTDLNLGNWVYINEDCKDQTPQLDSDGNEYSEQDIFPEA